MEKDEILNRLTTPPPEPVEIEGEPENPLAAVIAHTEEMIMSLSSIKGEHYGMAAKLGLLVRKQNNLVVGLAAMNPSVFNDATKASTVTSSRILSTVFKMVGLDPKNVELVDEFVGHVDRIFDAEQRAIKEALMAISLKEQPSV